MMFAAQTMHEVMALPRPHGQQAEQRKQKTAACESERHQNHLLSISISLSGAPKKQQHVFQTISSLLISFVFHGSHGLDFIIGLNPASAGAGQS